MRKIALSATVLAMAAITGCTGNEPQDPKVTINKNPYPSTYAPQAQMTTLIKGATVLTGNGEKIENAK